MQNHLSKMDAIYIFITIVEQGSFHAAAHLLGLPRSTISYRITSLEKQLGVKLLARTTRSVMPTDAGLDYYERVRPALELIEHANQHLASLTETARGKLKITASHGIGSAWLPQIIQKMRTQYPEVSLEFTLTDRYVDLISENYDVALRGSSELSDSNLISRVIYSTEQYCYASPAYLANSPPLNSPHDLINHQLILYKANGNAHWKFEKPEMLSIPVQSKLAVNNLRLMVEIAKQDVGVIRNFEFLTREAVQSGQLVQVLKNWHSPLNKVHVLTRSRLYRTAALTGFLEMVDQVIGKECNIDTALMSGH